MSVVSVVSLVCCVYLPIYLSVYMCSNLYVYPLIFMFILFTFHISGMPSLKVTRQNTSGSKHAQQVY